MHQSFSLQRGALSWNPIPGISALSMVSAGVASQVAQSRWVHYRRQ
ncbi:Uncharacterised protein [Vibrio cholerae]|nr:Uncharacterised protein [Vibrio cholerae]